MTKKGDRVGAVCSVQDGKISLFGEGTYLGDRIPSEGAFRDMGRKNPCIQLDDGNYVWGYQCWWGPLDETIAKYGQEAWDAATKATTPSIMPLSEDHEEMAG